MLPELSELVFVHHFTFSDVLLVLIHLNQIVLLQVNQLGLLSSQSFVFFFDRSLQTGNRHVLGVNLVLLLIKITLKSFGSLFQFRFVVGN